MAIKATCPYCSQSYSLAETQIGKKVRCKNCSEGFTVTAPPRSRDDDFDEPRRPRPKKKGLPTALLVVGGIGVFVVLLGCLGGGGVLLWIYGPFGNKVTPENFDKIQTGMSEDEVKAILGKPNAMDEVDALVNQPLARNAPGVGVMAWKRGKNAIVVTFRNGKVTGKSGFFQTTKGGANIQIR